MEELATYRADLLSALARLVDELPVTAFHISAAACHRSTLPGSPTPHFLLFQLCELEEQVFSTQLPRFVAEEHPFLPVFDIETWMAAHYQPQEPASAILDELLKLRRQELTWLHNLPNLAWSRSARHPWWGEHTLQWWVELQLEYSIQHLAQLSLAKDI
ncbi:MAG TPA: hypothetical protein VF831_10355 [Anaerolineales bacterium]